MEYEGDDGTIDFSFDRTYVDREQGSDGVVSMPGHSPSDGERWSVCDLAPIGILNEFQGLSAISFDTDGKVVQGKGIVAWMGHVGILFSNGAGSQNAHICTIRQYVRKTTNVSYGVEYDIMTSGNWIGALKEPDEPEAFKTVHITTSKTQTDNYVEVVFTYHPGSTPLPSQSLIFIENIVFHRLLSSEPYASYREKPAKANDVIDPTGSLDGNPAISNSVSMPVSMYRNNDRLLGTQVRSTRLTTYPYLFTPRKELKARFRITSAMPWPYALMVTHLNKRWRVIAQQWEPWNDEMVLTLEHSSILTNL